MNLISQKLDINWTNRTIYLQEALQINNKLLQFK